MKAVNDKEATESHKDSTRSRRKSDLHEDTVDGWKDDSQVIVNKMAWDSIKTDKNEVFTEKQTDDNTTGRWNTTVDGDDSSTTVDVTADDGGDVGDVDISSGDSKEESEKQQCRRRERRY